MIITTKVNIDLLRPDHPAIINAVQGDQNSRGLEISLFCGGMSWSVPENATVAMRYCKPDNTKGYYDTMPDGTSAWSFEGNTIMVLLAPQMLTVAGSVFTQVEMIQGTKLLATFTMQVNVQENPAAGVLVSEDYINWLQWMETELTSQMKKAVESGDFTGPPGPVATIQNQINEYQASDSYAEKPTGEWSASVPNVAQGEFLWTRTTVTYDSGDSVVSYSISRFGKDGLGSVVTVCGVSPDGNGNVTLGASDVGALSTKGGTMEGPINMNGQKLTGLNAPAENTEAATKGYVDGKLISVSITLPSADWADNLQAVDVAGVTADPAKSDVLASPGPADDNYAAYNENGVRIYAQLDGAVTFKCDSVPSVDLIVNVMVRT